MAVRGGLDQLIIDYVIIELDSYIFDMFNMLDLCILSYSTI